MSVQQIPRRDFLQQVTAAGTVAALGVSAAAEEGKSKKKKKRKGKKDKQREEKKRKVKHVRDLEHAHFEDLVGEKFIVDGSRHTDTQHQATLILVEAKEMPHPSDDDRPPHLRKQAFLLQFIARAGEEIEDGTHFLCHKKLFRMELFLHETERADDPHHKHYVAVFN